MITPKDLKDTTGRTVNVLGLSAQIKRLQVQDNDLVVMRVSIAHPTRDFLTRCQRALTTAIAHANVKALGVVLPFHLNLERHGLEPEFLESALMAEVMALREQLSDANKDRVKLQGIIDTLKAEEWMEI